MVADQFARCTLFDGVVFRTGGARSKDARRSRILALDSEYGGHPGWLLVGLDVVDAE